MSNHLPTALALADENTLGGGIGPSHMSKNSDRGSSLDGRRENMAKNSNATMIDSHIVG